MKRVATIIAAALIMTVAAPGTATAQGAPPRSDDRPAEGPQRPTPRPRQPEQQPPQQHSPQHQGPQHDAPGYGRWDDRWGQRPPPPPSHFTRTGDWHRHVRACQQRYRSYNARTDMFLATNGQRLRCRL